MKEIKVANKGLNKSVNISYVLLVGVFWHDGRNGSVRALIMSIAGQVIRRSDGVAHTKCLQNDVIQLMERAHYNSLWT